MLYYTYFNGYALNTAKRFKLYKYIWGRGIQREQISEQGFVQF